MRIFFLFTLLICTTFCKAQDSSKQNNLADTSLKKVVITNFRGFTNVEIESEYPGGISAWAKFLQANLKYPNKAARKKIEGTVIVQFIVDKDGSISDVLAIDGPENGGLKAEAERVIKISGNWHPAMQHGRKVKSYKKQPIMFKLQRES